MVKITGTIITLNEENSIDDCIKSMQKICDEIIVVDSLSTDKTVEIAKSLGARVYLQKYLGDGPQKEYGVQFANNDWILSIDADERIDDDMINAIGKINFSKTKIAYAFRRKNFVGKHWIKAAGFYPDYVTRLYNRNTAGYLEKKAHSRVKAKKVVKLNAHIYHYTYENYSHWMKRLDYFTTRDAWALYDKGLKPSNIRPVVSSIASFIRKYFLKGGIFQGMDGITVTLTTVMRTYMKYIKLNEMHENKDSTLP